jgi:hypothetical protein
LTVVVTCWTATAGAAQHKPLVSPAVFQEWTRVAICESGHPAWVHQAHGPTYVGALGILSSNWAYWSRRLHFPSAAWLASPDEQIVVAQHIEGTSYVPDQWGCRSW